jgi:hypothetical protein
MTELEFLWSSGVLWKSSGVFQELKYYFWIRNHVDPVHGTVNYVTLPGLGLRHGPNSGRRPGLVGVMPCGRSGGRELAKEGLWEGGEDVEALGGVGEVWRGRNWDNNREERAAGMELNGGLVRVWIGGNPCGEELWGRRARLWCLL